MSDQVRLLRELLPFVEEWTVRTDKSVCPSCAATSREARHKRVHNAGCRLKAIIDEVHDFLKEKTLDMDPPQGPHMHFAKFLFDAFHDESALGDEATPAPSWDGLSELEKNRWENVAHAAASACGYDVSAVEEANE